MKLYKLICRIGIYWVIAPDPTTAQTKLKAILDSENYGFSKERVVTEIHLVAEAIETKDAPFHLTDKFLLL